MNPAGEYHLHVLGMLRLERSGAVVVFPRRKAAVLFAYLALHPQQHRRDELATLLWGDYLDREARQSLSTALSTLRRLLGDDILVVDSDRVRSTPPFPSGSTPLGFETYARRFLAEPPFDLSTAFIDLYTRRPAARLSMTTGCGAERERLHGLYVDVLLRTAEQMRSRSEY